MNFLTGPDLVLFAGLLIVAVALAQVGLMVVATMRRYNAEQEAERLSLELLRHRVGAALTQHQRQSDLATLSWNGLRKFEVIRQTSEVEGVRSFYLAPHDGKPLPPYQPGQYLTFELKIPGHRAPVIRCYSLSDSPNHQDLPQYTGYGRPRASAQRFLCYT